MPSGAPVDGVEPGRCGGGRHEVPVRHGVADRAARRTAHDGAVTPREVAGFVGDYVEVQPRYFVAGTNTPLVKALADREDVTIDSPEDAPDGGEE